MEFQSLYRHISDEVYDSWNVGLDSPYYILFVLLKYLFIKNIGFDVGDDFIQYDGGEILFTIDLNCIFWQYLYDFRGDFPQIYLFSLFNLLLILI